MTTAERIARAGVIVAVGAVCLLWFVAVALIALAGVVWAARFIW